MTSHATTPDVNDPTRTASGVPLPAVAGPEHLAPGLEQRLGRPGELPFTRGIHERLYLDRPWTFRQLAGFGTAQETNARYRLLLERGSAGINGVFDYPSLRAFSSDDPAAVPDVGRGGVAVDVREDFDDLFAGIALDRVSVSLVSSQPIGAVPHLAMYIRAAERRGFSREALAGTSQNDFLMETAITIAPKALPPAASFRLECDLIEFAVREAPRWNPVSISGYNYREAGATSVQEVAFTLAHAQAITHELLDRGLEPETFLPRISFFLDAHSDFLEEVGKFRAARRMWARWVREDLGVSDPRSQRFRFHVQTSGATNTARFAHVNIARSALQGLSAVLGGTQSLHINGYDEAVSIPTEHAALTALRTQYVLLHEAGVTGTVDPLGGSYAVEYVTDALEQRIDELLAEIDRLGGLVAATTSGWVHRGLAASAFEHQQTIERGERQIVGVNLGIDAPDEQLPLFELPTDAAERQARRLAGVRERRDAEGAAAALDRLADACRCGENVMGSALAAVDADVTLGEFGDVFRDQFSSWEFPLW